VLSAKDKGFKVIIAGAGGAAHLPGMCAAIFPLPVIGVPIHTKTLSGVDSLYSIVQMPGGIPVATVAINGAQNAGILAAKMLAVSDDEMLGMRFVLRKKGRILMLRDERHWWLTGFVLGEFSKPEELGMEISISFPNQRMRNAVYDALIKAGYDRENIFADGLRLRFGFTKPRTVQPKHLRIRVKWVQWKNKRFCKKYLRVTKSFVRTIDRVDYLGMCFPRLYRLLGKLNRQKKR